ncbi:hypothetical protein Bpfe_012375, partial [Biomphalaria pfeifferi]
MNLQTAFNKFLDGVHRTRVLLDINSFPESTEELVCGGCIESTRASSVGDGGR